MTNTTRWVNHKASEEVVPEIDAFLKDIELVCKRHQMELSHEDSHGNFIVTGPNERIQAWRFAADDCREPQSEN